MCALHPLCAYVVAAAVEWLDYTLADKVLYRGLAALNSKVVFSPAFGFPCLFPSPVGELLSLLCCFGWWYGQAVGGSASEVGGGIGSNIDNNFVVTWRLADRLYLLTTARTIGCATSS